MSDHPSTADIDQDTGLVAFVPILLQKSVEARGEA
jgi:hypothetical protein